MEKFQLVQPSKLLRPYVKQYWFLAIDNAERSSQRYVPSGCAVLAFHRGDKIYSTLHQEMQPRSSLCGNLFRTLMLFIRVISIWLWLFSNRLQHGLY